ncbi:MAG: hypothetical protein OEZ48_13105 [Candidatus Bathyarchaeota archaeon]|nr:hypothetical protein [Candidatus Bathyarchaeota archaeon]
MVKVELGKEYVTFKLEGSQKFLALKSSVRIPLKKIDTVSTETVKPLWLAGKVGTHMPPIFWAGTFWTMAGKIFYYVRDRSKCITVRLNDHEYRKVVMEVDDKESVARELRKLIG